MSIGKRKEYGFASIVPYKRQINPNRRIWYTNKPTVFNRARAFIYERPAVGGSHGNEIALLAEYLTASAGDERIQPAVHRGSPQQWFALAVSSYFGGATVSLQGFDIRPQQTFLD